MCSISPTPARGVWADSAYRSAQIEARLKAKGFQSRIHRRAARNRPLSERQKSANTTRSKVRARVEHIFGQQQNSMGGKIVRTIGIVHRTAQSPAKNQNGPRSGAHFGTSAAPVCLANTNRPRRVIVRGSPLAKSVDSTPPCSGCVPAGGAHWAPNPNRPFSVLSR